MTDTDPKKERAEFIEKLEAAHTFPCAYTFKLFGPNQTSFDDAAHAVVKDHLPEVDITSSKRASSKANHQCLTLVLEMPSAESVVDLYAKLHKIDGLKMLL